MGTARLKEYGPAPGIPGEQPGPTGIFHRQAHPAGWLKFERGWLNAEQALKNLETAVSLLQTIGNGLEGLDAHVEACLTAVNSAWLESEGHEAPPEGLQELIAARLDQMEEIVRQCRFHGRGLLDGQSGAVGMGLGVVFIRGGPNTQTSPPEGYEVRVQGYPSRAFITGGVSLHEDWLRAEPEIFLAEGDNYVRYTARPGETVPQFLERLQRSVVAAGLDLDIGMTRQQRLMVRHNQYGSQFKFKGMSAKTPLLSKRPGKVEWSKRGRDIQGTLDGEPAFGIGRLLVGYLDNTRTSELAVMWRGGMLGPGRTGRVHVVQNALSFQDGVERDRPPVRISLPSFHPSNLGAWLETRSGFNGMHELRSGTWQELRDALHMFFAVSCELEDWRNRIQTWIQRYQNQALSCLRHGTVLSDVRHPAPPAGLDEEKMATQLRRMIARGA